MNLIQKIQKVFSTLPFYIIPIKIYSKIILKIRDYFQYKIDLNSDTYLNDFKFNKYFFDKKVIFKNIAHDSELFSFRASFIDINELTGIESLISDENKLNIVSAAQKLLNHRFNLLGSGEVNVKYNLNAKGFEGCRYEFNIPEEKVFEIEKNIENNVSEYFNFKNAYDYKPIDWNIDFKSGYRWNNKIWYKKINQGGIKGADIKVPWELSRFYHLITLGQAYILSQDENYTREFVYEITDWHLNNPPRFGVNWSCTMDAAIRACNMILGFSFFRDSKLITSKFKYDFSKIIFSHGLHIIKNLEKNYFVNTNHYLSDIVGLLYIGLFFYDLKIGKKWVNFAIKELKKEMKSQVYDDGADFEGSTCYHRLVLELFFYATYFSIKNLCQLDDYKDLENLTIKVFGKEYAEKLFKMFDFLKSITDANGSIPQIGDNDNGKLHILNVSQGLKACGLLSSGSVFYNREVLNIKKSFPDEEVLWLYGVNNFKNWVEVGNKNHNETKRFSFENGGFYIMEESPVRMLITSGQNGQKGIGGHSHNDKLSFNLSAKTEDIFVDCGTYIYTPMPKLRNQFRSTYAHNTVIVDKKEQNRFDETDLFFLYNDAKVKINNWIEGEDYYFFDGEHYGYLRLKEPVVHQRKIFFERKKVFWIVNDIFKGEGHHLFEFNFVLNSGLILSTDNRSLAVNISSPKSAKFKIFPLKPDNIQISIDEGFISESYGEKKLTKIIRYSAVESSNNEFIFIITYNKSDDFSISENEINFLLNKCKEKY
ncbi:MAG: alginate lyase family protein [Candidatus Humimicrobiaceae bacterium]